MAKQIVHQLIDDIDGTVLPDGMGETLRFGIDGRAYEIDLGEANASALRDALAPYIAAGRRARQQPVRRATSRRSGKGTFSGNVREWAASQGLEVPAQGRVPNAVLEAYRAAH